MPGFFCACALLSFCVRPAAALAQAPPDDQVMEPPAHVAVVDGAATLERDGQPDTAPLNMPLLAGDRIRTANGRVEILFGDASVLHLDTDTTVDFQSDELVRLLAGRVRLEIPGVERSVSYRIDAPWASAQITRSGEYRVGIVSGDRGTEIELDVLRGAAELVNELGRTPLVAGERAFARAQAAPSYAYVYNSAAWDAFDQWSEARRDERLGASSQYLPDSVRPYAASFDTYGSWQYASSYGYVWYPRVDVGWRPYYNGRWATVRPYGWTWIGADPWAWPTHHYGRWGFSAGLWFWIPGRSWGPAWVSWVYAPGYVSWCPLGWNNRPVIQFAAFSARGSDPWRAWTVAPQRQFNTGYVNVRRVGRFDLDARTRTTFSQGTHAPGYGGYAVPRGQTAIHAAGTARRSSNAPLYTNLSPRDSRVGSAPSRRIVGSAPANTRDRIGPAVHRPRRRSRAAGAIARRCDVGGADRWPADAGTCHSALSGPVRVRPHRTHAGRLGGTAATAVSPARAPTRTRRGTDMGVGGSSPSVVDPRIRPDRRPACAGTHHARLSGPVRVRPHRTHAGQIGSPPRHGCRRQLPFPVAPPFRVRRPRTAARCRSAARHRPGAASGRSAPCRAAALIPPLTARPRRPHRAHPAARPPPHHAAQRPHAAPRPHVAPPPHAAPPHRAAPDIPKGGGEKTDDCRLQIADCRLTDCRLDDGLSMGIELTDWGLKIADWGLKIGDGIRDRRDCRLG